LTESIAVDKGTARKTALTVAVVLAAIGAWQIYRSREVATAVFMGLAGILALVAFVPPLAILFHRGWMAVAAVLGYVNTRILLSLVFYTLLTPIGVWRRLTGHDPLMRRSGRLSTYWARREKTRQSHEGFERAF
jgi:hypothetical protein